MPTQKWDFEDSVAAIMAIGKDIPPDAPKNKLRMGHKKTASACKKQLRRIQWITLAQRSKYVSILLPSLNHLNLCDEGRRYVDMYLAHPLEGLDHIIALDNITVCLTRCGELDRAERMAQEMILRLEQCIPEPERVEKRKGLWAKAYLRQGIIYGLKGDSRYKDVFRSALEKTDGINDEAILTLTREMFAIGALRCGDWEEGFKWASILPLDSIWRLMAEAHHEVHAGTVTKDTAIAVKKRATLNPLQHDPFTMMFLFWTLASLYRALKQADQVQKFCQLFRREMVGYGFRENILSERVGELENWCQHKRGS